MGVRQLGPLVCVPTHAVGIGRLRLVAGEWELALVGGVRGLDAMRMAVSGSRLDGSGRINFVRSKGSTRVVGGVKLKVQRLLGA